MDIRRQLEKIINTKGLSDCQITEIWEKLKDKKGSSNKLNG